MSERSKYSLNGVYICENFAQYVDNDNCPYSNIGFAGRRLWRIRIKTIVKDGSTTAFPIIYCHNKPRTQVHAYFNILKKDGSSAFKTRIKHEYLKSNEGCVGDDMDIEELLNEDNGYLDEGALTVEYGLQVNSEQGEDGIWMFNFHDKFFEWQTRHNTFELNIDCKRIVFGHKQIMKLHLTTMDANKNSAPLPIYGSFLAETMIDCLQITHGVRLQLTAEEYEGTIIESSYFGFFNTIKYCEQRLIEMNEQPESIADSFQMAVEYDMRRYLKHLLKQIECRKQLAGVLKELNIEDMTSASMKAFIGKYFDLIDSLE